MTLRFVSALGVVLAAALPLALAQVTDPHITSWLTSRSAQYARVYETAADKTAGTADSTWPRSGLTNGGGGQSTPAYSDIQRVAYSTNSVYIYTTGLASYTMGNWLTPNGQTYTSWPANRAAIHRIPRTPTIPTTKQKTNGNGGILVNGVFVWENGDAQSYSTSTGQVSMGGQGIWNRLAGVAEVFNFDPANGHQPSSGAYHNHVNPVALRYQLGDNVTYNAANRTYNESGTATKHSPILGWANDGLPIYGPYGYSVATDATSGIRRMTSGFTKRDGTNGTVNLATTGRITLPLWAASVQGISQTLPSTEYGPSTTTSYTVAPGVTSTYAIGIFAEDYEYLGDLGKTLGKDFDLNRQNVRYCVTPEYPNGTYAYFVCIDSSGTTVFPDIINQEYYGTAAVGTGTVNSINETVTEYVDAGPAANINVSATASGSNVSLLWNSAEGATYKVESAPDNATWTTLSSTVTSGGLSTTYLATTNTNYYRVTLTAIATYDTGGTYGTALGKTATVLFGTAAAAPTITTQPANVTVTAGTSATFTVVASGTGTLSYQWKKGAATLAGATGASYTIASPQVADSGSYSVTITNSFGTVTSNAAALTVNAVVVAPAITTQPSSQAVTVGTSVTFTVAASGSAPFTYQWNLAGAAIAGATSSTYALASAQVADAGNYSCAVSNSAGTATSNMATLTVTLAATAPAVTTQPSSQTVPAGGSVTFTVVASGTAPLSYQWSKSGAAVAGATAASYAIGNAQATDAGSYTCVVSNSAGTVTTNAATLTVTAGSSTIPTITTQPVSQSVASGATVTFTVGAGGATPLGYQWHKGVTALSGATAASYTIASAQTADAGSYACVVSNSFGTTTSASATLTVDAPAVAPAITTQPAGATVTVGNSATFAVVASGTAPLSYQWQKDGTAIAGALSPSYAITTTQTSDAGAYICVVTNGAGTVTSSPATLVVSVAPTAPSIAVQPVGATVFAGGSASFFVVVNGSTPLAYQWQKNGNAISGATSAALAFGSVQLSDIGTYSCVVSNAAGSALSVGATLTVTTIATAPTITTQPASVTVGAGLSANFSVVATGSAPLGYQWYKGFVPISGAVGVSYAIAVVQASDAASYQCVVTNATGSATSNAATLAVISPATAPAIVNSPAGAAVLAGASVTFSLTASGTAPLAYQWRKDGVAIPGATSTSLTIASAQPSDAAGYSCVVTNVVGAVTSSAATLTVNVPQIAPTIVTAPSGATVTAGTSITLSITAGGTAPLAYQWLKNGLALSGATAATFTIASAGATDAANYACTVSNSAGSVTSAAAALTVTPGAVLTPAARIVNLAVRTRVGGLAGSPSIGFALSGTGSGKRIIVRAVGPTLAGFGVAGALADPALQLWSGGVMVASNDDWLAADAPAFSSVGAFPLLAGSTDAALVSTLAPGTYSTPIVYRPGATGILLLECYDGAPADPTTGLSNASALAYVGTGDDVLIPGFVISGNGTVRVLVRAIGPSLAQFGVSGTLPDPQLTLVRGNTVIGSNDNWGSSASAFDIAIAAGSVGAFAVPSGSKDAALLLSLPAGSYSATVSGVGSTTGTALVEIYVIP